jgi:hypothetical protein
MPPSLLQALRGSRPLKPPNELAVVSPGRRGLNDRHHNLGCAEGIITVHKNGEQPAHSRPPPMGGIPIHPAATAPIPRRDFVGWLVGLEFKERVRSNQARLTAELKAQYDFVVCGSGSERGYLRCRYPPPPPARSSSRPQKCRRANATKTHPKSTGIYPDRLGRRNWAGVCSSLSRLQIGAEL